MLNLRPLPPENPDGADIVYLVPKPLPTVHGQTLYVAAPERISATSFGEPETCEPKPKLGVVVGVGETAVYLVPNPGLVQGYIPINGVF